MVFRIELFILKFRWSIEYCQRRCLLRETLVEVTFNWWMIFLITFFPWGDDQDNSAWHSIVHYQFEFPAIFCLVQWWMTSSSMLSFECRRTLVLLLTVSNWPFTLNNDVYDMIVSTPPILTVPPTCLLPYYFLNDPQISPYN